MDRYRTARALPVWSRNISLTSQSIPPLAILQSERSPDDRRFVSTHALDFPSGYRSAHLWPEEVAGTRPGTRQGHPRVQGCAQRDRGRLRESKPDKPSEAVM